MKLIKFAAILSCLFFACTNAFAADEVVQVNLTAGSYFGSPSTFYMNKTQQKFCYESTCDTILSQLSELPAGASSYVGTVINGVPLIDREGRIIIKDYTFKLNIPSSPYSAKNLFRSESNIALYFTGTNASPGSVTMNIGSPTWMNSETGDQILKLTSLPTTPGKKFLAFSTTENFGDDGTLIAIDGDGNILSSAESLFGGTNLYALWENLPISCNAGEFLPKLADKCKVCAIGSWCPGGTFYVSDSTDQGTNRCGDGMTSEQGSDSIDDCVAPMSINCNAGEYLPSNSSTCTQCIPNNWCPGGSFYEANYEQGLTNCKDGMISNWGSTSESACHVAQSITCSAGQFLEYNTCSICQDGNWCPGGTFIETFKQFLGLNKCPAGTDAPEGSDSADDCTAAAITCTPGECLSAGKTSCEICWEGWWCPGGIFTFNSDIHQGCNYCGSNYLSPVGSDSADDCTRIQITCNPGEYLPFGQVCASCPSDSWCPGGTFTYDSFNYNDQGRNYCSAGYTSPVGSDSNDDCKSGSSEITCIPSQYLPANSLTCSKCNPNNWCPGGTFYEAIYPQGINSCPEGTVCNWEKTEASSCHTPGVITCSAGNYLNYGKCDKCPKDTWCPGGEFVETYVSVEGLNKCASGETSPEGSDSADDCKSGTSAITCNPGEFLRENSSSCESCSPNFWCPGGDFYPNIYDQGRNTCKDGLISIGGSIEENACHVPATLTCSAGTYMNYGGCVNCLKNNWCPGGNFLESYTTKLGINSCPVGTTSPEGSDEELDCKAAVTIHCDPGYYFPYEKAAPSCAICRANYFCIGGDYDVSIPQEQGIKACKDGLVSPIGSDSEGDCYASSSTVTCSAGTYLPSGASECQGCTGGNWCPGGNFQIDQVDQGINACPNEGSSYVNSYAITSCYKDHIETVIPNGYGMQSCYYGTVGYTENCVINYATACDGGYYNVERAFCEPVGNGYYSPNLDLKRYECPALRSGLTLKKATLPPSDSAEQCYLRSVLYTTGSDLTNGIGTMDCFYSKLTKGYGSAEIVSHDPLILPHGPITDPQCQQNKKVVLCFGGFFLENDVSSECIDVGNGFYSPRPDFGDMTGCFDGSDNCPYEDTIDITDYQSARGRETCPDGYSSSQLPRKDITNCYKECKLDVPNAKKVSPKESVIFYQEKVNRACQYDVECNTGYKVVDNGTEKPSCVSEGGCQNDPNAVESDSNCVPIKCKDTYHIEDKKCVENVRTCPIENGLGRQEWMKDNILGGKWTMCTAYLCNPGYTSERYLTNETSKPCGECKNRRDKSGNIVVSAWGTDSCKIATCMYQNELYRFDALNNSCIQICDTAGREDITGTMLWDPLSEKCERSCKPGFTNW